MAGSPDTLRIGVYLVSVVQFLDISPVDIFGCMSREYLDDTPFPEAVKKHGKNVIIKYITPAGPAKEPFAPITASAALRVDHSIHDAEVQPGKLDILMVPGPPPRATFTEEQVEFVRRHFADGKGATVMSVCTGALVLAASGISDGREVTAPRGLLPELRSRYPRAKWQDKRWVKDPSGKIWSSGGVTNGQDMVAAYLTHHYPGPFVDIVLALADVEDRGQDYESGETVTTLWWVFAIFRSWLKGGPRGEKAKVK